MTTLLSTRLDNGLEVLIRRRPEAPLASCWIWYNVGSRDEQPGQTGMAHFIEHMLFKGTARLPVGEISRRLSRAGAQHNAYTWLDFTAYFATLPASEVRVFLDVESDRMLNATFDPVEVERERTVILSEREGYENSPETRLDEGLTAILYQNHPYRQPVIGWRPDIAGVSRDTLYSHYASHYGPNRARLILVGDLDPPAMLAEVERYFAALPARAQALRPAPEEPEPVTERRLTLRWPAPAPLWQALYPTVPATHADFLPLLVADAILTGGKAIGFRPGARLGTASRLYRRLVVGGLAARLSSFLAPTHGPGPWTLSVTAHPNGDLAAIEAAVDDELGRLASTPPSADELGLARRAIQAQFAYATQTVTNVAELLGMLAQLGFEPAPETIAAAVAEVTAEDVSRVVAQYFAAHRRAVGWLLPTPVPPRLAPSSNGRAMRPFRPATAPTVAVTGARAAPERRVLANGAVLLHVRRPIAVLRLTAVIGAGADQDADRPGIAALTARTLLRGTRRAEFAQLSQEREELALSLTARAGADDATLQLSCLVDDARTGLRLLGEALREATFPAAQVDLMRAEQLTELAHVLDDTQRRAWLAASELLYGPRHPYARPSQGDAEVVQRLAGEDLMAFHRAHYGADRLVVAVVSPLETDALAAWLEDELRDWIATGPRQPAPGGPRRPAALERAEVALPGKEQADLVLATPAPPPAGGEGAAFELADFILGRLAFMGRLGEQLRERDGLAYYASSSLAHGRHGSHWLAYAGVAPENIDRAVDGVRSVLRAFAARGPRDDEMADAKRQRYGGMARTLDDPERLLDWLLFAERHGLDLDPEAAYATRVAPLGTADVGSAAAAWLDADRLALGIGRPA
jgi:zinc protease